MEQEFKEGKDNTESVIQKGWRRIKQVVQDIKGIRRRKNEVSVVAPQPEVEEVITDPFWEIEQKRDPILDQLADTTRILSAGKKLGEYYKEWDEVEKGNLLRFKKGFMVSGEIKEGVELYSLLIGWESTTGEHHIIKVDSNLVSRMYVDYVYDALKIIPTNQRDQFLSKAISAEKIKQLQEKPNYAAAVEVLILLSEVHSPKVSEDAYQITNTFGVAQNDFIESLNTQLNVCWGLLNSDRREFIQDYISRNIQYDISSKLFYNAFSLLLQSIVKSQINIVITDVMPNEEHQVPTFNFRRAINEFSDIAQEIAAIPRQEINVRALEYSYKLSGPRVELIDFDDVVGTDRQLGFYPQSFRPLDERDLNAKAVYFFTNKEQFISPSGVTHTEFIKLNGKYYLSGKDGRHRTAVYKALRAYGVAVLVREAY